MITVEKKNKKGGNEKEKEERLKQRLREREAVAREAFER